MSKAKPKKLKENSTKTAWSMRTNLKKLNRDKRSSH